MRRAAQVLAGVLLLGSCTASVATTTTPGTTSWPTSAPPASTTTSTAAPTTTTVPALVGRLPDPPCSLDPALAEGEVTVARDGLVFGLSPDGSTARCLVDEVALTAELSWGPVADRLLAGDTVILADGSRYQPIEGLPAAEPEWTTPAGVRLVYVIDGALLKSEVDGSGTDDVGFLANHFEFAYHPAGTHYLVDGTSEEGEYGMWLARNDASTTILVATDEGAILSSPDWAADGQIVFVAAHEDGRHDLHRIFPSEDLASYDQLDLVSTTEWLGWVVASPFNPVLVAYAVGGEPGGGCAEGRTTEVVGVDLPEPLASTTSLPIGWLPDDRLVVAAYPDGCEGAIDVWVFTSGFCPGTEYGAALLVSGVEGVAERVVMPPPPPSPEDFTNLPDPAPA
jgi:hypothetical protein